MPWLLSGSKAKSWCSRRCQSQACWGIHDLSSWFKYSWSCWICWGISSSNDCGRSDCKLCRWSSVFAVDDLVRLCNPFYFVMSVRMESRILMLPETSEQNMLRHSPLPFGSRLFIHIFSLNLLSVHMCLNCNGDCKACRWCSLSFQFPWFLSVVLPTLRKGKPDSKAQPAEACVTFSLWFEYSTAEAFLKSSFDGGWIDCKSCRWCGVFVVDD